MTIIFLFLNSMEVAMNDLCPGCLSIVIYLLLDVMGS